MHRGYVKLWRKVQDSFLYQDSQAFHLFFHLVLEANHKDKEFLFNGKKQVCRRGQVITGRKSLADKTGIDSNKVYRLLEMFKNEHLIDIQKTNKFSLVSIVCYEQYQSNEPVIEQQLNNKRTTTEQQVNTNNNDKNVKNEEEAQPPSFSSFLKILKSNPKYSHIDIDAELERMDEWLSNHPNKQKTQTFIINWLNRIEIPFESSNPRSDFEKFCQQQGA